MLLSVRIVALTGLFALIANGVFVPSIARADDVDPDLARPPAVTIDSYIQFNNPQVPIPGLNPKMMIVAGKGVSVNGCPEGSICARTISSYLNAFYRYAAAAAISFAIVLIMVGGIQYTVGSAMGQIDAGKKRMWNAVIGLVLVLSTHAILSFVNPDIVTLQPLALDVVKNVPRKISYRSVSSMDAQPVNVESGLDLRSVTFCGKPGEDLTSTRCTSANEDFDMNDALALGIPAGNATLQTDATLALQNVVGGMYRLYGNQKVVYLRGAYENPVTDADQFFKECVIGGKCDAICDPFAAEIELSPWQLEEGKSSYVLKEAYQTIFNENGGEALKPEYKKILPQMTKFACAEHSGKHVDVTCSDGVGGPKDLRIVSGMCQAALEQKMKEHGFCRSYAEPWLFIFGAAYEGQSCDWIPGTIFVDKNADGKSDEEDCESVRQYDKNLPVAHMGKAAESRGEDCIFQYANTLDTIDVVHFKVIGNLITAPKSKTVSTYLLSNGLLSSP